MPDRAKNSATIERGELQEIGSNLSTYYSLNGVGQWRYPPLIFAFASRTAIYPQRTPKSANFLPDGLFSLSNLLFPSWKIFLLHYRSAIRRIITITDAATSAAPCYWATFQKLHQALHPALIR
jgi:hypothetical protein